MFCGQSAEQNLCFPPLLRAVERFSKGGACVFLFGFIAYSAAVPINRTVRHPKRGVAVVMAAEFVSRAQHHITRRAVRKTARGVGPSGGHSEDVIYECICLFQSTKGYQCAGLVFMQSVRWPS